MKEAVTRTSRARKPAETPERSRRCKTQARVVLTTGYIYTFRSSENNPMDQDIGGQNPTARDKQNGAKSKEDSFLAI
ncbi:MAG TPA: hypothetical protein P5279_13140 [Anaerohalosphaeraceae bacterium]|jgi:hypothetical protein|nr:hypothetical protein [Anaerohalosphaeraceae bacterium]HRT51434.1 hypothetical protein [Anaerohalosphaeraceae bacterium]HRT87495.1 hypothetical protein [Anaerohalosphaeraceae bacterium]